MPESAGGGPGRGADAMQSAKHEAGQGPHGSARPGEQRSILEQSSRDSMSGASALKSQVSGAMQKGLAKRLGNQNLKAQQQKYNNFINDSLKDVSDKVKEVISTLNQIKEELHVDYELNEGRARQQKEEEAKSRQVMKHLMNPVKVRQRAKLTIKQELDDHLANYPQNAHELPGMRRKKEREHNIEFLKNVVTALKVKDDPIQIAQKEVKDEASKKLKSANHNLLLNGDDSESEGDGGSDGGSEGDDFVEGRGSVDSDSSAASASSNASVSYDPAGKKRRYYDIEDEYHDLDPTYYAAQLSTQMKPKSTWRWQERNIDMQVFGEEEKKHKEKLQFLAIRLNKFIAKRNISFNQAMVFKRWHQETEEWRQNTNQNLRSIGNLRKFIRVITNEASADQGGAATSGPTTADSEGKVTDEAQETHQKEEAGGANEKGAKKTLANSRSARFKSKGREEDDDKDIKEADTYTQTKLIPNCFGVYNPH